jgi:hypothetical protein
MEAIQRHHEIVAVAVATEAVQQQQKQQQQKQVVYQADGGSNPSIQHVERVLKPQSVADNAPGIHNGNAGLDGIYLHNETHCGCGEVVPSAAEKFLFVKNEQTDPMICVRGHHRATPVVQPHVRPQQQRLLQLFFISIPPIDPHDP